MSERDSGLQVPSHHQIWSSLKSMDTPDLMHHVVRFCD